MPNMLQQLADQQECISLALRYASGVDDQDIPRLMAVFTADARMHAEMFDVRGPAAIGALVENIWSHVSALQHAVSNFEVTIDGDEARMRSTVISIHIGRDSPDDLFAAGAVYFDRLVRSQDGWRIAERFTRVDWKSGDPSILLTPTDAGWTVS